MVCRKFAVEDFLEVGANVPEAVVQALEGLQLFVYSGREGADGYVADVAEEVFYTNFFGFFCLDDGGGVDKGFGGCGAILWVESKLVCYTDQCGLRVWWVD